MSKSVAKAALGWVGKDFRPGVGEMCMGWVREVLHQAKHPLRDTVTKAAVDGMGSSYWLASSLAGRDVGQLVAQISDLKPGSVVFFANTYGDWAPGTITHVGIYVGEGKLVHRPTMARPVELVSLVPGSYWGNLFRCGLLLPEVATLETRKPVPPEFERLKIYAHSGKVRVLHGAKNVEATSIRIDVHSGKLGVSINGKAVDAASLELAVAWDA